MDHKYKHILTAGPNAVVPLDVATRQFLAAVSDDDPPTTAQILKSSVQFPPRLVAQLREDLKVVNVEVVAQTTVSPEQLESLYRHSPTDTSQPRHTEEYARRRDDVRALLVRAVVESASDIHIVRRRRAATVSFRVAGQIQLHEKWQEEQADQICRFIYEVMCHDQAVTWNRSLPQDAVLDTVLSTGERIRVRIGTIPASPEGYDMVLRILPGSGDTMTLSELGYTPEQLRLIQALTRRPSGLVVMAGSVGSGKSTSIVGMLNEELMLHAEGLRIITVEDPPEREIPGATQVPVVRRRGHDSESDFSEAIRGALRCDPDTLMVGEIRDLQSAVLTIKFAQSGHRVYTTVHAQNALGIVARLTGLNIEPSFLCTPDLLKGLMHQSLVPLLCASCKITASEYGAMADPGDRNRDLLQRTIAAFESRNLSMNTVFFRGPGCSNCAGTGIKGRTLIAEIVIPDETLLVLMGSSDYIGAQRHWRENMNGQPAIEHGVLAVAAGTVSPSDVEFRISELSPYPVVGENVFNLPSKAESGHA